MGKKPAASREKILDEVRRRAHDYEFQYRGWSQCTLLSLQEVMGLEDDSVFQAASGLAGGIGRTHHTCGALLGGAMALSLKYGRTRGEFKDSGKMYCSLAMVEELVNRFEKEFGSVNCRDITTSFLGEYLDTRIPEQRERAEKLGLHDKCADLVGKTAVMTAEIMLGEE